MRTPKLLIPSILAAATLVTLVPDTAEADPRHRSNRWYWQPRRAPKNAVPELAVGSAGAALALVGGSIMVMTGRRRRPDR